MLTARGATKRGWRAGETVGLAHVYTRLTGTAPVIQARILPRRTDDRRRDHQVRIRRL